jgi:hypothetical protein
LHVARSNGAAVAHTIAVLDGPGEDVCYRFDAATRVPGKAGQIILRDVIAEVVQKQEWVEVRSIAEAERSPQVDARTFERRLGHY